MGTVCSISSHPGEGLPLGEVKEETGRRARFLTKSLNCLVRHSWKCHLGLLVTNGKEKETLSSIFPSSLSACLQIRSYLQM